MNTAFLALPQLESNTSPADQTSPGGKTDLLPTSAGFGLTPAATDTITDAVTQLNKTLLSNDTVKYVVVPAMFGGLGSVALQMIQEGGTFMIKAETNKKTDENQDSRGNTTQTEQGSAEQSNYTTTEQVEQDSENLDNQLDKETSTEQATVHDFVPSIQMGAGLEFLILVASSVLLGAVVGFIGAILSLDGPPEKANNKSKLAATALMFALFFPSVITVFQQNAVSQAKLLKADSENNHLKEQVIEKGQQAANIEEAASKQLTDRIETLESEPDVTAPPIPSEPITPLEQLQDAEQSSLMASKISLIDSTKDLVLNATSEEKAKEFITSIFKIGDIEDAAVRNHAIEALREIEGNQVLPEIIQQTAAEQAQILQSEIPNSQD